MPKYGIGLLLLGAIATSQPSALAEQASVQQPALPPGAVVVTLDEGEQIRDTLGAILNSIVTDDEFADVVDFESMVDRLSAPDRRRIGDLDENQLRRLTSIVRDLEAAWQQRFGDDDLGEFDEDRVFENIQLAEGRIGDPATLAGNWPVKGRENAAQSSTGATGAAPAGTGAAAMQLERDTDIAVATVSGAHGEDPIRVSLINERFDRWRVAVPVSVTADTLLANLERHLGMARQHADKWPADRDAAHGYLAYHVLMALYDTGSDQSR